MDILGSLPPLQSGGDRSKIRALLDEACTKLVVIDDDPTGTQTVHGIPVLTEWSATTLAEALLEPGPCFYILSNSRALTLPAAVELNREIARNLSAAARSTGRKFTLVSRSDSTLRGHFPGEVEALIEALDDAIDNVLVVPAFFEGGRYTIHNVHYVADGDRLLPAGETEFARDATFGYRSSNLADWIQEKSLGRILGKDVAHISIETLRRHEGARAVCAQLLDTAQGRFITVDAAAYEDLEVLVHGVLLAEAAGRRYLARTAAGFVRVRAGITPRALLTAAELVAPTEAGGLIVVGSYVAKTTGQLHAALELPASSGRRFRLNACSIQRSGRRRHRGWRVRPMRRCMPARTRCFTRVAS